MLCSLSGCDKLSRPGAALGLATLTQLVDLDLSYIGATPPDDEDVETARELQAGLNGIGYSTWVRLHVHSESDAKADCRCMTGGC